MVGPEVLIANLRPLHFASNVVATSWVLIASSLLVVELKGPQSKSGWQLLVQSYLHFAAELARLFTS